MLKMFKDFEKRVDRLESENKALKDEMESKFGQEISVDSLYSDLGMMIRRTPRNLVIRFSIILPSESLISYILYF